jgi:hypothetical protein
MARPLRLTFLIFHLTFIVVVVVVRNFFSLFLLCLARTLGSLVVVWHRTNGSGRVVRVDDLLLPPTLGP